MEVDKNLYRPLIGSLLYVATARPDIMQVVGLVVIFQFAPKETHVLVVKIIIRYLKDTTEFGLWCLRGKDFTLTAFIDTYKEGSIDDTKSTSGGALLLGKFLVSWLSKKQTSISLSIAKA
jgi:hypothetical protein